MPTTLNAQVVINLSLNIEDLKVDYTITTCEGACHGINQLAEKLMNALQRKLPEYTHSQGAKQ